MVQYIYMLGNISAVILTKNEEKNISECLKTLSFCDERIVIDDNSSDKTREVAKKEGAIVIERSSRGDFAAQRNFGLAKASGNWILFVDADERVSEELAEEIYQQTSQFLTSANGFMIKRQDILWGKPLRFGDAGNKTFLRLARKEKGKWVGKVHERWEIIGEVKTLHNPLQHFPHTSVASFLTKINYYSTLRAQELFMMKKRVSFFSVLLYPLGKFITNYCIKQGFRDGTVGIIHALMMSFHSFLVRGKLWQLGQQKKSYDFENL